jgi:hypothetical protein
MGQFANSNVAYNQQGVDKMFFKKSKTVQEESTQLIKLIVIGTIIIVITNLLIIGIL